MLTPKKGVHLTAPFPLLKLTFRFDTKNAFSFDVVKKGSDLLIEEFPNYKDIIETKEKIEKI